MNTDIQDSVSLAEALTKTLKDGDDARLDAWAAARHRIATDVVATTDRITRMATLKSGLGRSLRNVAFAFAGHLPPVRARHWPIRWQNSRHAKSAGRTPARGWRLWA
jgi:2-polyprenyl-6-methoxyphenol hydroxylase-like FAD-dependent oxidoreductase